MAFETLGLRGTARVLKQTTVGFALLVGMGLPALAQSVVVQGNRRVDTETIRSYVAGQSVEQARQDLQQTGLFSSVSVTRRGSQTVVTVRENEVINRVVLQGAKKIKSEALLPELATKARGPFSQQAVDSDVARIKELYARTGRGLATVSARVVTLENGRVDVVFDVNEGDKTGVKSIEFVGNSAFSSGKLRDQMNTTESNFLSWLKTSDVYDPDKIASDLELVRRYYLRNGYADFRVVSTDVKFDQAAGGYRVVVTVDEGRQYRVGDVAVESRIGDVDADRLRGKLRMSTGDVYNAEDVEKTLTGMTTEVASRGYAFSQVRPRGDRDPASGRINLGFIVEEGPRVYIERINVRGNTRTRDYVIRREFDVGEGDAYNKVMVDRAERRLNNLGYFKKVRITNEPGSTPDRVIVNVDVEDQPTGAFAISGGYSTSDGFIAEVSVTETNFLGRGQYVRVAASNGQYSRGVDFSFTEPYFLDRRMAVGFDLFSKQTDNTKYSYYENRMTGGTLRLGLPITEEVSVLFRYSLYQQTIKIPNTYKKPYNDCWYDAGYGIGGAYPTCIYNGEASVAIKEAQGDYLTSALGYTLVYNTLDNVKNPRSGWYAELKQDAAGLGGDSKYLRTTSEVRYYRELTDDIVGMFKLQGGHIFGKDLRIVDQFFMGPGLVRGFAPSGIGPRDAADPKNNALGGTTYFGASVEAQFPIWGVPRELGFKGAVFADAGTMFGYEAKKVFTNAPYQYCPGGSPLAWTRQPTCVTVIDEHKIRSSVGASLLWQSPLGPIRFDLAYPITKDKYDRTQIFRFSGGTSF